MTFLLDNSVLIARLSAKHQHNAAVLFWGKGKDVAVCPITELGFVRVVCQVYGVTMTDARRTLGRWKQERKARFIPCDISALDGMPPVSGGRSTDIYLCKLGPSMA